MEKEDIIAELLERDILVTPDILEQISSGKKSIDDFDPAKPNRPNRGENLQVPIQRTAQTPTQSTSTPSTPPPAQPTTPLPTSENASPPRTAPSASGVQGNVSVVWSYDKPSKKRSYDDFVQYFRRRFEKLSSILQQRRELQGVTSIARLQTRNNNEKVAIIGIVTEKTLTKNKNYILTIEDFSGEITVVVHHNKNDAHRAAGDIILDEIIGVVGGLGDKTIFADSILFPDIPHGRELKKGPIEEYAVFVGDPQIGGQEFLHKDFNSMLRWLRGEVGTPEQRRVASLVKYAIVVGDLVEGVGVYPGQEDDLEIKDIEAQYEAFAALMERVPPHIHIIVCPGNHDAGRIAEPQPPLYRDFAKKLYEMPNITVVSSPGIVNIGATKNFSGFEVLIYHGYSIPWLADNIPSIRNAGGQKATDRIMKFMLQRRHLAPTHGSNQYIPDPDEDPMIIDRIPDFFATGHIHRVATASYRNITLINPGCWTDITENQIKRGLEPEPARLPIVNLKTRNLRIMNFFTGGKAAEEEKNQEQTQEETP